MLRPSSARLSRLAESFRVVDRSGRHEIVTEGARSGRFGQWRAEHGASIPACRLEHLGDPHFRARHGLRFACMSGAMANGIGSVEIVEAMARAGFLGVFGSAGLSLGGDRAGARPDRAEPGRLASVRDEPDPQPGRARPGVGRGRSLSQRGVRLVEASAFLNLTLPVVRYRVAGISRDALGPGGRAQSDHRQGFAGRGRLEVPGAAAGSSSCASW